MIVKVQSSKDPNMLYEVNTETGTCTCPQYTRRLMVQMAHEGDPCTHCGTALNDVAIGRCPGRPALTCKHIETGRAATADMR